MIETLANTIAGAVGSWIIVYLINKYLSHLEPWLVATLIVAGCTLWSLFRNYNVRRVFDKIHHRIAEKMPTLISEELYSLLKDCKTALLDANRNGFTRGHHLFPRLNEALSDYRPPGHTAGGNLFTNDTPASEEKTEQTTGIETTTDKTEKKVTPMTKKPVVQFDIKGFGSIKIELNPEKAPGTVRNFLKLVEDCSYNGNIFHRVIPGFMIQGGGFEASMTQITAPAQIENEANNGLKNDKYTIAMARTTAPHSASRQFFINSADNPFLNHTAPSAQGWGYAVFGKVIAGFEVVDAIGKVKTGRKGFHDDVPNEAVLIEKAFLVDDETQGGEGTIQ